MNSNDGDGWDGGFEDLIDSGEGVEELYIGAEQRYDMEQGHVPYPSFATRPSIPGKRRVAGMDDMAAPDYEELDE
jgi:hypothetical protein